MKEMRMEYAVSDPVDVPFDHKRTDIGAIPEDWSEVLLRDLGVFMKGRGISRDDVSWDGVPCIRYGELYTLYETCVHTPISRATEMAAAHSLELETGDLLFTGSGETIEEIGKCVAYIGTERACAGGDIIVLRPFGNSLSLSCYLGHLLNHDIVARQKTRVGQGHSVVHISPRHLELIGIPLPPPAEQQAIVDALSDVDGLIGSLDALIAKKRVIKHGAMQQLLTGKTRLPGFDGKWEMKRLGDLLRYERPDRYIVQSIEHRDQGRGAIPVLTANKSFILGYTGDNYNVCHDLPTIIFDDFTTESKYVNFP